MEISLNKYVSDSGFCSRRDADKFIEQGRVSINKITADKGNRVKPGDTVEVDGERIKSKARVQTVYIAFNKPKGITSTTDTKDKNNLIDFIRFPSRIFPIGRLDKLSDGLIFLTNDGDIVNKILRAGNNHEKEYLVSLDQDITSVFIDKMKNGVRILNTVTKKCAVEQVGKNAFKIILKEGLNRQIRRMCETLGFRVKTLTRIRIMNISLKGIAPGKWRYFTQEEIKAMQAMVANSSKTEEASVWKDGGMDE